jgi:hypothetical protein
MRMTALAALALALSACGSSDRGTSEEANALGTDNLMMDDNPMMDSNASMNGAGGMDANASTSAATEANLMEKDAVTNDRDTNLANGL